MAKFGFSTSEVDLNERVGGGGSYEPLPDGEYTLKATEAVEKETKNRDGSYIAAAFEVVRGEYAGRKVWTNFNIHNKSEKAQAIGRQQLASWAAACGKPNADDTDTLIDVNFNCTLGLEKGTGGYADKNKITSFLFESADSAPKATPKPAAKPAPAPAANKANPWD